MQGNTAKFPPNKSSDQLKSCNGYATIGQHLAINPLKLPKKLGTEAIKQEDRDATIQRPYSRHQVLA